MDCGLSPVVLGQRPNEAQTVVNTDALSSETFSEPLDLSMLPGGKCSRSPQNPITVRSEGSFSLFPVFIFSTFCILFFLNGQTLEITAKFTKIHLTCFSCIFLCLLRIFFIYNYCFSQHRQKLRYPSLTINYCMLI